MKKITTEGWILFSERSRSKNFKNNDETLLLKTIDKENADKKFEEELKKTEILMSLGVPVPKYFEVVEVEKEGYGIIGEYIKDKKSFARAISEDFTKMSLYIKKYADLGKILHSTKADKEKLPSMKVLISGAIEKIGIFNEEEKKKLYNVLYGIEEKDNCLQADFQISNAITTKRGDLFIDMGLTSFGNEIFDIAMLYDFLKSDFLSDDRFERPIRMPKEKASLCFKEFLKCYYDLTDEKEIKDFEEKIKPIGFLMLCYGATESKKFLRDLINCKDEYIKLL